MARIISVNYEIPGHSYDFVGYYDDRSLLDADIVVFEPDEFYPSYDEDGSKIIQRQTNHWRKEITTALEDGKTVFVVFGKHKTTQIYTGQKDFKGSRTINYVTNYDNYQFLPFAVPEIIPKGGTEIVFKGHPAFANFWKEFKSQLAYASYLNGAIKTPVFVTKTGERPVGGVIKSGKGHMVLIPTIPYSEKKFITKNKKGENVWTKDAMQFGRKLTTALIGIDKVLRSETDKTPPPEWVEKEEYKLAEETAISKKIEEVDLKIKKAEQERAKLNTDLGKAIQLKDLLFETGKTLENAVNEGLRLLGYTAENYNDGVVEIDHVILSPEGERFVGECEGKDNSAVNIDKFRQLEENIQSDLQREEVSAPATGILFGNGHRLTDPNERGEAFTEKCLTSAKRGTILIRTMDLYHVARRVKETGDADYAKRCRQAISDGKGGIVKFPAE